MNFWSIPHRIDAPELLDAGQGTLDDVQASLGDLWRINRYLGGLSAITAHLYPRLLRCREAVIADIGTGAAHIPLHIAEWARLRGIKMRIVGLDFSARNLRFAQTYTNQAPEIALLQADANALPFAPASIDYVISSLFLHHFTPDQVIALLRQAAACARCGLVVSDLERGWLPYWGFKAAQPIFARSYLTRYDGAVSVLRAYTAAELRAFADAAGLRGVRIHQHFPFRITLTADRT